MIPFPRWAWWVWWVGMLGGFSIAHLWIPALVFGVGPVLWLMAKLGQRFANRFVNPSY
jgi:hypothetical protein